MEMILVNGIDKNYNKTFEDIKHIDENGIEFWYARELMPESSSVIRKWI